MVFRPPAMISNLSSRSFYVVEMLFLHMQRQSFRPLMGSAQNQGREVTLSEKEGFGGIQKCARQSALDFMRWWQKIAAGFLDNMSPYKPPPKQLDRTMPQPVIEFTAPDFGLLIEGFRRKKAFDIFTPDEFCARSAKPQHPLP